ncbi:MAG: GNAT family N-acetyltransferase, partial [Sphingobacteriaceae bacterium]|nr:GNAT family N-acetyltransferase [Cytophagaceae bacterium]
DLPYEALDSLLDAVEKWAVSQNLISIRLTQWPAAYAPELAIRLDHRLKTGGYRPVFTEKNQHLDLTRPLTLHDSARRRFRKAERAGFAFEEWKNPDWETAHAFLHAARTRKSLPLSMTAAELRNMGEKFPEEIFVFTVCDGLTLAALGVVIRLNARILYHFLPADSAEYSTFSPTIFLNLHLADWARQRSYGLLDLGISTHHGVLNEGLLRFKANLGAGVSGKSTWEKVVGK